MTLFEEILLESDLLTESVSVDNVVNAITGMHPVWITYDDTKGGGGKARRLIYPVAYGLTTSNNPVIRAFQPSGSSKRGLTTPPNNRELPKWKYFRLDRIKFWRTITSQEFDPEELVGINKDGDRSMSKVYVIAPIGNAKKINRKEFEKPEDEKTPKTNTTSFEPRPITKDEVENIDIEPTVQPNKQRFTAKDAIDSIIRFIKNTGNKVGSGIKKVFNKNLENKPENPNINTSDTINAPDTKPTTKDEIGTSVNDENNSTEQLPNPTDKPVTKTDVDNGEEDRELKENVLTKSFNDMMNRMNNLEK